jgi:hypothetical protein
VQINLILWLLKEDLSTVSLTTSSEGKSSKVIHPRVFSQGGTERWSAPVTQSSMFLQFTLAVYQAIPAWWLAVTELLLKGVLEANGLCVFKAINVKGQNEKQS